jgi:NAD(P)H-hydrate epimerase
MEYVTPEEMRVAEAQAASYGLDEAALMENAGLAVASLVEGRYPGDNGRKLLVVCGLGNNGGDGLVAARQMGEAWKVRVLLLGPAESIRTRTAAENWRRLGPRVEKGEATDVPSLLSHGEWFSWADVILDSILGTGVKGTVREPMATAIRLINASRAAKVAVDIPSGLDPLAGEADTATVRAHLTAALHRPKVGLRGKVEYTGEVVVLPIGIVE